MAIDPIDEKLAGLVVQVTDLVDEARRLNRRAEMFYDELIAVALMVRHPGAGGMMREVPVVSAIEEER